MKRPKRTKLFVDRQVQGALLGRVVVYWSTCLLFVTLPTLIAGTLNHPDRLIYEHFGELWGRYWPILTAAIIMLPLLMFDVLKLSHRFVGPLLRLRREMVRLSAGELVGPLRFREADYWHDLADSFSRLAGQLQSTTILVADGQPADPPESSCCSGNCGALSDSHTGSPEPVQ